MKKKQASRVIYVSEWQEEIMEGLCRLLLEKIEGNRRRPPSDFSSEWWTFEDTRMQLLLEEIPQRPFLACLFPLIEEKVQLLHDGKLPLDVALGRSTAI